jgi:hypothetical protein
MGHFWELGGLWDEGDMYFGRCFGFVVGRLDVPYSHHYINQIYRETVIVSLFL